MTHAMWASAFGDAYTERNRVQWRARVPFWESMAGATGAKSALEVGCNAGWNMLAIRKANPKIDLTGIDVNEKALAEAEDAGLMVENMPALQMPWTSAFDLVFTVGVLIHIPPAELQAVMRNIVDSSGRWVLAVEYDAPVETEINYRGTHGTLWKRPFGQLYAGMGLEIALSGHLTKDMGFDRCTYWLFSK